MSNATKDWLRAQLFMCFESPRNALRFVEEKRRMTNGKLYKFCPIDDSGRDDVIQYSIENLRNSIIYMSRLRNFNDPFDSYVGLSFDEIMRSFLPSMLKRNAQMSFDDKAAQALPDVLKMLLSANQPQNQGNRLVAKYFIQCVKQRPGILKGEFTPEELQADYLQMLLSDLASGNVTQEEISSLAEINDANRGGLLAESMKEMMQSPQLLSAAGIPTDVDSLAGMRDFLAGKNPQIATLLEQYQASEETLRPVITESVQRARAAIDNKCCISCFSTRGDNALMWAHYANKHKGFCIEYDLSKCADDDFMLNLHPVIYSNMRAAVPMSLFRLGEDGQIRVLPSNESTADLICALLTKSDVWKYEEEWRLLLFNDNDKLSNNTYSVDCISKVILGCNIEEKYENELSMLCRANGYGLSKMMLDASAYQFHEHSLI